MYFFPFVISLIFIHANVKRAKMHTCGLLFFFSMEIKKPLLSFQRSYYILYQRYF